MEQFPKKQKEDGKNLEMLKKQEALETREQALRNIDRVWEIINDINGLPLSVDPAYEAGKELLTENAEDYAKSLFEEARNSTGKNRLRYAVGLSKLLKVCPQEQQEEILSKLLTTPEAIDELRRKGEKELPATEKVKRKANELKELISLFKDAWFP